MSGGIAIGVGCRSGASVEAIEALIRQALEHVGSGRRLGLFTVEEKGREAGLIEAAGRFGLALIPLGHAVLRAQADFVRTRSVRMERMFGVGSVAEAAALAGAGFGAELVLARIADQGVTCAIARVALGGPASFEVADSRDEPRLYDESRCVAMGHLPGDATK